MKMRFLALVALLWCAVAFAQVDATYNFRFFTGQANGTNRMEITPISWGVKLGTIITADRLKFTNDGSGFVTVSNMATNFAYRVDFHGPFTVLSVTNYFPIGTTGAVNAADYLIPTNNAAAMVAYTIAQANARFYATNTLRPGTNTTLRTVGGVSYIDTTGGTVNTGGLVQQGGTSSNTLWFSDIGTYTFKNDAGSVLDLDYINDAGDASIDFVFTGSPTTRAINFVSTQVAANNYFSENGKTNDFQGHTKFGTFTGKLKAATVIGGITISNSIIQGTDGAGNFTWQVDSTGTAQFDQYVQADGGFIGLGSSLTALNASSISSGTLAPLRHASTNSIQVLNASFGLFMHGTNPPVWQNCVSNFAGQITIMDGRAYGFTNIITTNLTAANALFIGSTNVLGAMVGLAPTNAPTFFGVVTLTNGTSLTLWAITNINSGLIGMVSTNGVDKIYLGLADNSGASGVLSISNGTTSPLAVFNGTDRQSAKFGVSAGSDFMVVANAQVVFDESQTTSSRVAFKNSNGALTYGTLTASSNTLTWTGSFTSTNSYYITNVFSLLALTNGRPNIGACLTFSNDVCFTTVHWSNGVVWYKQLTP